MVEEAASPTEPTERAGAGAAGPPVTLAVALPAVVLSPPVSRARLLAEVGVVLALAVLPDLARAIYDLASPGEPVDLGTPTANAFLLVRSLSVAGPLLYVVARSGIPASAVGLARSSWASVLLGGLLLWAAGHWMHVFTWKWLPGDPYARTVHIVHASGVWETLLLLAMVTANAFAEELAMRGFLIDRLVRLTGRRGVALLLSSACFASYHLYQGVHGASGAFLFGLLQGLAFLWTRRLWPLVAAHALSGAMAFL